MATNVTGLFENNKNWNLFRKGGDKKSATSHRNVATPPRSQWSSGKKKYKWEWRLSPCLTAVSKPNLITYLSDNKTGTENYKPFLRQAPRSHVSTMEWQWRSSPVSDLQHCPYDVITKMYQGALAWSVKVNQLIVREELNPKKRRAYERETNNGEAVQYWPSTLSCK